MPCRTADDLSHCVTSHSGPDAVGVIYGAARRRAALTILGQEGKWAMKLGFEIHRSATLCSAERGVRPCIRPGGLVGRGNKAILKNDLAPDDL